MSFQRGSLALSLLAVCVSLFALGIAPQRPEFPRGKLVHSFPPVPLFRGVAGPNGDRARAEILYNGRGLTANAVQRVELAMDVVAFHGQSGERLGDFCVERVFDLEMPLDLKKISLEVTETGVSVRWPDGETQEAFLFQPGTPVEVSLLAFALRGDGWQISPIERASLRVQGDLDGDGLLEFELFQGTDHQGGRNFTS